MISLLLYKINYFHHKLVFNLLIFSASIVAFPMFVLAQSQPIKSPIVKRVLAGPTMSYFTYPHANGFYPANSNRFVVAQFKYNASGAYETTNLVQIDPDAGTQKILGNLRNIKQFYSISENGYAAAVRYPDELVFSLDLNGKNPNTVVYTPPNGWGVSYPPSISRDGSSVVFAQSPLPTTTGSYTSSPNQLVRLTLSNRKLDVLSQLNIKLDHVHLSPFNQSWISFCNGAGTEVQDRIWAWNGSFQPNAVKLMYPQLGQDGKALYLTHERLSFNKNTGVVIAPASSPSSDIGVYEYDFFGNYRLVSYGPNDLHVNISKDGQLIVVDTQNGFTLDNNTLAPTDIVLINAKTGDREVLYTATMAVKHPYHAHPHISPDNRYIIFNDARSKRVMALELDPAKLAAFLNKNPTSFRGPLTLNPGQSLTSNGIRLSFHTDGNLVARNVAGKRVWESKTQAACATSANCRVSFQGDGNLVIYNGSKVLWSSATNAFAGQLGGSELVFSSSEPYLRIRDGVGSILWTSSNAFSELSLGVNQYLRLGSYKYDNKPVPQLTLLGNGNLAVLRGSSILWQTNTIRNDCGTVCHLEFQKSDGNLVLYFRPPPNPASDSYWSSNTFSSISKRLMISDSPPYLTIKDVNGTILWRSS